MENKSKVLESTILSKGQVVIPAELRDALNLKQGDKLVFNMNENQELVMKKMPTAQDWRDLIKEIPNERVDISSDGTYDAKLSPHFHEWMMEDQ